MLKKIITPMIAVLLCITIAGCNKNIRFLTETPRENYSSAIEIENRKMEIVLSDESLRYYGFLNTPERFTARVSYGVEYDLWNAPDDLDDLIVYDKVSGSLTLNGSDIDMTVKSEITYADFKQICFDRYGDRPMADQEVFLHMFINETAGTSGEYLKRDDSCIVSYSVKLEKMISDGSEYSTFCKQRCTAEQWAYLCEQANYQITTGHTNVNISVTMDKDMKIIFAEIGASDFGEDYLDLEFYTE